MTVDWSHKHQFALICNLHTMYGIPPHSSGRYVKEVFPRLTWTEIYDIVSQAVLNYDEIYAHLKKQGMVE